MLDWEATADPSLRLDQVNPDWQVDWILHFQTALYSNAASLIVYADLDIARMVGDAAARRGFTLPALWLAHWQQGTHDTAKTVTRGGYGRVPDVGGDA